MAWVYRVDKAEVRTSANDPETGLPVAITPELNITASYWDKAAPAKVYTQGFTFMISSGGAGAIIASVKAQGQRIRDYLTAIDQLRDRVGRENILE